MHATADRSAIRTFFARHAKLQFCVVDTMRQIGRPRLISGSSIAAANDHQKIAGTKYANGYDRYQ